MVFEGIRSGLRPIYLNPDDAAFYNDPLPAEVSFRCIADTAEDLVEIIKSNQKNPTKGTAELNDALDFADSYLMPMRPEILIRHLNKVLL